MHECRIGMRADNPHDWSARVDVMHRDIHRGILSSGDKRYLLLELIDV